MPLHRSFRVVSSGAKNFLFENEFYRLLVSLYENRLLKMHTWTRDWKCLKCKLNQLLLTIIMRLFDNAKVKGKSFSTLSSSFQLRALNVCKTMITMWWLEIEKKNLSTQLHNCDVFQEQKVLLNLKTCWMLNDWEGEALQPHVALKYFCIMSWYAIMCLESLITSQSP